MLKKGAKLIHDRRQVKKYPANLELWKKRKKKNKKMRKANSKIYDEIILLDSIVAFLKLYEKMTHQMHINIKTVIILQDLYSLV